MDADSSTSHSLSAENLGINSWVDENPGNGWVFPQPKTPVPAGFLVYREEVMMFTEAYKLLVPHELDLTNEEREFYKMLDLNIVATGDENGYFVDAQATIRRFKQLIDPEHEELYFAWCVLFGMLEEARVEYNRLYSGDQDSERAFRARWCHIEVVAIFMDYFARRDDCRKHLPKVAVYAAKHCLNDLFEICYDHMTTKQKLQEMHKCIASALLTRAAPVLNTIWNDVRLRRKFDADLFYMQFVLASAASIVNEGSGLYWTADCIYTILGMKNQTPFALFCTRLIAGNLLEIDAKIVDAVLKQRLERIAFELVDQEAIDIYGKMHDLDPLTEEEILSFLDEPFNLY